VKTTTLVLARTLGCFALVGVLAVVAGCAWNGPRTETAAEGIQEALQEAVSSQPTPTPPEPPAAVSSALMPAITVDAGQVESDAVGQRFEIAVNEAPARQFFMSLVDGTSYNMVVHPEVDGLISLDLKSVTIPEVMEVVRSVYGYEYRRTRLGFEVMPARLQSRIYQVNYLNMIRGGHSQTRVSSGQVSQGNGRTTNDERSTTTNTRRHGVVTGTEINTELPDTTFWTELRVSIEAILGELPGRSVVVNPQSGVVVVRAMPNEQREVESFLATTESITQRQVVLEAKIIEVELDDAFREGINWAAVFGQDVAFGQSNGRSVFDADTGSGLIRSGDALGGDGQLPVGPGPFGVFGGVFSIAIALDNFKAFIELLDKQGTVHVLSSPRISAINNQKAVIKVGTDEFFVTDISSTTTTGTATTTTPSVELTPFFSGIALDVTPQISELGEVTLHVHPSISEVRDQQKEIKVGDISQTLPLAQSTVRESDTVVHALSGQVVVIGGLMQERFVDDTADTPLGRAPLLRYLSAHKRQLTTRSELIILLRPIVVNSGQQWAGVIRDSQRNIERIHGTAARLEGYGPAPESVTH
jgi:MSHA biogenesis protein MshL